jgi:hypothetical protein
MEMPTALLKCIAKASLNAVGGGVAGDFVVEVMPGVFRDVWGWWCQDRSDGQRRAELEVLAQAPAAEVQKVARQVAREVAEGKPADVQLRLETYLTLVPASLRRPLRRQDDPRGATVPPALSLQKADPPEYGPPAARGRSAEGA